MKKWPLRALLMIGIWLVGFGPKSGHALLKGDSYAGLLVGTQIKDSVFQSTLHGGYVIYDELGLGFWADFLVAGQQGGVEIRWIFEPFELASGLGLSRFESGQRQSVLLPLSVAYLFALTPRLAMKAELRAQFYLRDKSTLYTALGLRYVL